MAYIVREMLETPIKLADQVAKVADEAQSYKQNCLELKAKTEELAGVLRQALRASNGRYLYACPTCRIIYNTLRILDKALALVTKCRAGGIMKRVFRLFTFIPAATFRKTSVQLENSIGDVSWLLRLQLRVSASVDDRDDGYDLGVPPIAANEPILCLIWEQIAILRNGSSLETRSDAAASLVSLALENDRCGKLIIEEDGLRGLLQLAKGGSMEGQENAARAIVLMGRDPENVKHIVDAGICYVFAKILKEGHMKVQAVVAWAISELAGNITEYCQDHFARHNAIRLLVSHLAFETIEGEGRELRDPATEAQMKALAAKALWKLSKGYVSICQDIAESRALLCFAVLLEKGADDVQSYSAMALMEITAVAEQHSDLRRNAFKPASRAAKAVVEQLLKIIEDANSNSDLLVPCIKSVGNLASIFRATDQTRVIGPLVRLLDEREAEVSMEAAIALNKFACPKNFLHVYHCKAITDAGGAEHLIQLVYFGEQMVQFPALILLCYIALHVDPYSETLAHEEVLTALSWSSKRAHLVEEPSIESLLSEAKCRKSVWLHASAAQNKNKLRLRAKCKTLIKK